MTVATGQPRLSPHPLGATLPALYLDDLKTLAAERRQRADTLNRLAGARAFTLASHPAKGFVAPQPSAALRRWNSIANISVASFDCA